MGSRNAGTNARRAGVIIVAGLVALPINDFESDAGMKPGELDTYFTPGTGIGNEPGQ